MIATLILAAAVGQAAPARASALGKAGAVAEATIKAGDETTLRASRGLVPAMLGPEDYRAYAAACAAGQAGALRAMYPGRMRLLHPGTAVRVAAVHGASAEVEARGYPGLLWVPRCYLDFDEAELRRLPVLDLVGESRLHPEPGDELIVWRPSGGPVPVALSYAAWEELEKFIDATDGDGLLELLRSGRAIPVESGTRVLVVKVHDDLGEVLAAAEVRILEGEHRGRLLWTTTGVPSVPRVVVRSPGAAAKAARRRR